jgi:alpha-ketoglutarate-dependent taurine dioxygenase
MLRGFDVTVEEFEDFSREVAPDFLIHHDVGRGYVSEDGTTQTVMPGSHGLPAHVERGYAPPIPNFISFICIHPAESDGETTLYDGQEIFEHLSPEAQRFFAGNKMRYRMRINRDLWQRTLMTDDQAEALFMLEEQLKEAPNTAIGEEVSCAVDGEHLILDYLTPATRTSKKRGGLVFANSCLPYLYGVEGIMKGDKWRLYKEDGADFPVEMLKEALRASEAVEHKIQWKRGDVVFVDNHHVLHGRAAFSDPKRSIYVRIGFGSL